MARRRSSRVLPFILVGLTVGLSTSGPIAAGEAANMDPSGTWAMVQITSEITQIPIVGERTRTTAAHLKVTIERKQDAFAVFETLCVSNIDDGTPMVKTTIPDAFVASVPVTERSAYLEPVSQTEQPAGDSNAQLRIVFPWSTQVLGAQLEDPENEQLPTDPEDPRVVDQDGDGHPGLTVRVEIMNLISGEVYVVQRNRNRLTGTVESAGFFQGTIEWESEQVVLGASNPFLASGGTGTPDPDPEHNFFLAKRIDPELDCEEVKSLDLMLLKELTPPQEGSEHPEI